MKNGQAHFTRREAMPVSPWAAAVGVAMPTQLPINASQIAQCSSEHPRKCRAKGIAHSLGEGEFKGLRHNLRHKNIPQAFALFVSL